MSSYRNACPPEYLDEEDTDDYEEHGRSRAFPTNGLAESEFCSGVKIIPKLGFEAGLNKSDFETHLDVNSQLWFDRIHQYWRQCELFTEVICSFINLSDRLSFQVKSLLSYRMPSCNSSRAAQTLSNQG